MDRLLDIIAGYFGSWTGADVTLFFAVMLTWHSLEKKLTERKGE